MAHEDDKVDREDKSGEKKRYKRRNRKPGINKAWAIEQDGRRRGRPRTPLREKMIRAIESPDEFKRLQLSHEEIAEALTGLYGRRLRSDPPRRSRFDHVNEQGVVIGSKEQRKSGKVHGRDTRSVRLIKAGCEQCGGDEVLWRS